MFWLLVAVLITMVFLVIAARRVALVPESRLGSMIEMGIEFVRDSLCVDVMGEEGKKYVPFIGSIFFLVLVNTWSVSFRAPSRAPGRWAPPSRGR